MNIALNADCMEIMREYPDKYFDLAVVDPPYGSGGGSSSTAPASVDALTGTCKIARTGGKWAAKFGKKSRAGTMPPARTISMSFSG